MATATCRIDRDRILVVVRSRVYDRPPVLTHTQRPAHFDERLGGDEFAGRAVEHVEEAVLGCLGNDLAHPPIDVQIQQHELLHIVEVPVVVGCRLVEPLELTRVQIDREDRAGIKIVDILGAAELLNPGLSIAGAHVDQVGLGVVGEAIPHGATAAILIEIASPGFSCASQSFALIRLRRIARHRIEAPQELSRLCIHGDELTAGGFVAAARQ